MYDAVIVLLICDYNINILDWLISSYWIARWKGWIEWQFGAPQEGLNQTEST